MDSSRLPPMFFISRDGGEARLDLSASGGKVRAAAEQLSRTFQPGACVGLIYRTSPELVVLWLATLKAGLRPLILQYPTTKQSRAYWEGSVRQTVETARLEGLLCGPEVAARLQDLERPVLTISPDGDLPAEPFTIPEFSIVQLSSGTTGHRKAVEFTASQLRAHVEDYQQVVGLTSEDRIVSWLPLYHDMGFIACFVMPMLTGTPVIMMDPEDWVADKALLYRTIARHRGTVVYMPNFGFEVMAQVPAQDLSSMRLWVSCSEPTKAPTIRRFLVATGTPDTAFASCYAMAENVFAVALKQGLSSMVIDEADVVSCGAPIAGVELKIVDDQIHVRSRSSIESYLFGDRVSDTDGFYPTGDLGCIVDGELYVTGRVRDLMIQAGKKYMLSDIDAATNEVVAEARGRAATFTVMDERLGTQKPVVLIESRDFLTDGDRVEAVAARIRDKTGLDLVEVAFVPPMFLTKTSSGKMNRVLTAQHWKQVQEFRSRQPTKTLSESLTIEFGRFRQDVPVGELLDSLAATVLAMILADHGVAWRPEATLAELSKVTPASASSLDGEAKPHLNIVSLADSRVFRRVTEKDLSQLGARLGMPVRIEHICLPPSPVLLSDMIFCRYFLPRLADQEEYSEVLSAYDKLSRASLIIVDDAAEFYFPLSQIYPVLSHRFERQPEADLVAVRWQRYADRHHKLPAGVVPGEILPLKPRQASLEALSRLFGAPLFRVATITTLSEFTSDWELQELQSPAGSGGRFRPLLPQRLLGALGDWIEAHRGECRPLEGPVKGPSLRMTDLAHFCSHYVNASALERVLQAYDSFCIAGRPASVPRIAKRLAEMGKHYSYAPSMTRTSLEAAGPHECLLTAGCMGTYEAERPTFVAMGAGWGDATRNIAKGNPLHNIRLRETKLQSAVFKDWFNILPEKGSVAEPDIRTIEARIKEAIARSSSPGMWLLPPLRVPAPQVPAGNSTAGSGNPAIQKRPLAQSRGAQKAARDA